MSDIYVDPTLKDLSLENGVLRITKNKAELARQGLEITLKAFRGEWFANRFFGLPYIANDNNNVQLLEKNGKDLLDLEIKAAILDTVYITEIISYSSVLSPERTLTVNFVATTEDGEEVSITDIVIA